MLLTDFRPIESWLNTNTSRIFTRAMVKCISPMPWHESISMPIAIGAGNIFSPQVPALKIRAVVFIRRHHLDENVIQKAVKAAIRQVGI